MSTENERIRYKDEDINDTESEQLNPKKETSGFDIATIILWIIIGILLLVIVVEAIFLIVGVNLGKTKNGEEPSPSQSVSQTTSGSPGQQTPTPGKNENNSSGTSSGSTQTSKPTATQGTSTNGPSQTTPPQGGSTTADLTAAKIIDPSKIDYSFLSNKSTAAFADAAKGSYDWYPGSTIRDSDGNIKYEWDRYASTLKILNENHGIYRKNTDKNVLYLTFDCGYEYGYTTKILDTLKEKNVKAIFFVTGGFVNDSSNHALLKRMYNEGHLIGSHTENHKVMPTLSNEEFVKELNTVYRTCKNILGEDFTMAYYRPPQGASNERDLALASYLGYNTVFWSATHPDYNVENQPDPAKALNEIKTKIHPGAVYLLHAVSSTNAEILGDFISYAESEGFEFKRMDE